MSDYAADIAKYTASVDAAAVDAIVRYCGIALRHADSAVVALTDPQEVATVRDGFAAKKLGLDAAAAEAGLKAVAAKMKGETRRSRVTVYYLLAEGTGTLGKLA